ncbi:MAG: hypothetical protein A2951_03190 [Candidatus Buchananbacteria bacterium RIFCSPLOWO2_01_FULL_56_15]|uniref:Solute-binding protein family 5 domain-containing protein n=2 Tax=Candidatus Buchananiibacteriota TaxID=1817903 RepID=A0A1G1YFJ2_9BACT|nr:MAG: hypothetical protein A3J59_03020 [Candidatus Buchananbacteria bacterium RIFCSPHIGHO2_02_FULL_56_16]OGY55332.1 MAG: hypothetical protein A2951_03190 [Candidatus Buchananbacteria bacterium RIFCSPLOWO2_01_FULL_56_15]
MAALVGSLIFIAGSFYLQNFIPVPVAGGEYTEGLIGAPQYANPLLSQTNDVDSDLARLIFSGLVAYDKSLELAPDLAERWEIDEAQTTYTFVLRENLRWHDGQPLTADDVVFTVKSIQDPDFKSPLLVSLRGVEVKKIDDRTVSFSLPEAYPDFLEVMTFGLLPEHIWGEIPPVNANLTEYNLRPVGAGPWQFKSLTKDRLGNIRSYTLVPNPYYYGSKPFLEKLTFKFYPDFQTGIQALKNNSIEGLSFLPKDLKKDLAGLKNLNQYSLALPQYTAVFFNQKENESLATKDVRQALALAIDKPAILSQALQLEGEIIDGPILPGSTDAGNNLPKIAYDPTQASALLDQAGWKQITPLEYADWLARQTETATTTEATTASQATTTDTAKLVGDDQPASPAKRGEPTQAFYRQQGEKILTVKLTTVDQSENVKAAELVSDFWRAVGVKVELEIISGGRISRDVIKPRRYEALLFGIIVGSNPDPFPFWHSSQVQDPGLNLALYANRNVDKALEDARKAADEAARQPLYRTFEETILADLPAIFLYNPTYTYVADQKIKGLDVHRIILPADRFNNIEDWYVNTKRKYHGNN